MEKREIRERILDALNSSQYKWRTARSLAKAADIPIVQVQEFLERSPDILRARKPNRQGHALYSIQNKVRDGRKPAKRFTEERNAQLSRLRSIIIAPMDPEGRRVHDTATRALRELGIGTYDFAHLQTGTSLVNAIINAIRSSDFVIADVTRQSPNVIYEVGFAHALAKPTILLVDGTSTSSVPSFLAGFIYHIYDSKNLHSLADIIKSAAQSLVHGKGEV
jgi:hypothetical protein